MKKLVLILALLVALAPVASSQNGWVSQNGNMGFIARSANSAAAVTITQQNASACSLALKSGATTAFSVCGTAVAIASTATLGWSDVILARDAANTLALRNGTAAQAFNVYNTYTSSTNNEALFVGFSANTGYLQTTKGSGGGSARNLRVETGSTGFLALGTNATIRWYIDGSTGHFLGNDDNTYDIGASGATRPRTLHLATSLIIGTGSFTTSGVNSPGSITLPNANAFYWGSRTLIKAPADGTLALGNNAETNVVNIVTGAASTGRVIQWGTGSPEGVVTASIGSLYLAIDGGASTTLYVKTSGTGNTGWTAK